MDWLTRLSGATKNLGDGLEVLNYSYSPALFDNVPHRHTYFEICLVGDWGEGIFTLENTHHPISSGDIFFARPGVPHQIQNTLPMRMELFWVCFTWNDSFKNEKRNSETAALWRDFASSNVAVKRDDGTLKSLWKTLQSVAGANEFRGKDAQLVALQRALLLQIAGVGAPSFETEFTPAPDPHRVARLGARYIRDNLTRRVSVAEVAAHLHVSQRHFGRLFWEFAGCNPSQFIVTARMDKARHLLRGGQLSIKEIAGLVGYDDVHHFTRAFTRELGVSPAAFRMSGHAPKLREAGEGRFV